LKRALSRAKKTDLYFVSITGILYETIMFLMYVFFSNKIVCLQSDLNTEPLNQNVGEQETMEKVK
jgi:hypothetical protein